MKEKKEEKEKKNGKKRHSVKDKKSIFSAAVACAAVILAVVLAVTFATAGEDAPIDSPSIDDVPSGGVVTPDDGTGDNGNVDVPVEESKGMALPLETVSVTGNYGFHYNQTLNCYFHHEGVDFTAEAGSEVFAAESGIVESVFVGDVLSGGEIVIDHGDGLKTTYRFVEPVEGLQAGDEVKKGDVIAVVSEATGSEYKDGAHLHFEISEGGKAVDPTTHLTLEEK